MVTDKSKIVLEAVNVDHLPRKLDKGVREMKVCMDNLALYCTLLDCE